MEKELEKKALEKKIGFEVMVSINNQEHYSYETLMNPLFARRQKVTVLIRL